MLKWNNTIWCVHLYVWDDGTSLPLSLHSNISPKWLWNADKKPTKDLFRLIPHRFFKVQTEHGSLLFWRKCKSVLWMLNIRWVKALLLNQNVLWNMWRHKAAVSADEMRNETKSRLMSCLGNVTRQKLCLSVNVTMWYLKTSEAKDSRTTQSYGVVSFRCDTIKRWIASDCNCV